MASRRGSEKHVETLLKAGAQANADALEAASAGGYDKIVRMLIEAGAETPKKAGII
jgi:choline dehydrogenase-like flavoprotein